MTNEELVALIQEGTNVTENMGLLYQQNINLIKHFIYPFTQAVKENSTVLEEQDLMQEAYFGLHTAALKYDASQGAMFMTYAAYHIVQSVRRYKNSFHGASNLPENQYQMLREYKKFCASYFSTYGEYPSKENILKGMQIDSSKLDLLERLSKESNAISLNTTFPGTEDCTVADVIADEFDLEESVSEQCMENYYKKIIWEAVSELPEPKRTVIEKYFKNNLDLIDIADEIGISKQRVSELKKEAIRLLRKKEKLQEIANEQGYSSYLNYHFGVQRCKDTRSSSTEYMALKHLAMEERIKNIETELAEIEALLGGISK